MFDQELLHDFDDDDMWVRNRKPLIRDIALDKVLTVEWKQNMATTKYQKMLSLRKQLPVFVEKDQILKALTKNRVL